LKTAIPAPCPRLFVQICPRQWVDCAAARTTFLDPFLIHEPFLHDLYFEPRYEEFKPRTIWSLSNAFTSAFKELDPIPQFKATAKLSEFLKGRFS